jgi:hypothetical protein
MLVIRQCRTRVLINLELLVVGRLRIPYVSVPGQNLGCTDMTVDFVDILAKLDKINRITDGW